MNKIECLKAAARALEAGTFPYLWEAPEKCNCGVVFCAAHQLTPTELDKKLHPVHNVLKITEADHNWENIIGVSCPITGAPVDLLFGVMLEIGFTLKELVELETLKNPAIRKEAGFGFWHRLRYSRSIDKTTRDFAQKENVIRYLDAWVRILEREASATTSTNQTVNGRRVDVAG